MKGLLFFLLMLVSAQTLANKDWVEVFNQFNSASNWKQQKAFTTDQFQLLSANRVFRKSNIIKFHYRRFTVGEHYGLLVIEDIETDKPIINRIYQEQDYKIGVLLKLEGGWKVDRIFEPKQAALNILVNEPNWAENNKESSIDVDRKKYQFESAAAFQDTDGSVWIYFYPFKLDHDDLQALVWGESNVMLTNEQLATTIASSAPYHRLLLHIPDVDNLYREVTMSYSGLEHAYDNRSIKTKGKDFIAWAQVKNGYLIFSSNGFLPSLSPQIETHIKFKIPIWTRGIDQEPAN